MRHFLLCLLVGAVANGALAQVYKTTDANGNVIYSDAPKTNKSTEVALPKINSAQGKQVEPAVPSVSLLPNGIPPPAAVGNYEVAIISPRHDVSIPPTQEDLPVVVNIAPSLEDGFVLRYLVNNEVVDETTQNSTVIPSPPRGSLTLEVEVIDPDGEVVARSAPVTAHLLRIPSPLTRERLNPTPSPR